MPHGIFNLYQTLVWIERVGRELVAVLKLNVTVHKDSVRICKMQIQPASGCLSLNHWHNYDGYTQCTAIARSICPWICVIVNGRVL